jgi:ELWxxDGT repeat protein
VRSKLAVLLFAVGLVAAAADTAPLAAAPAPEIAGPEVTAGTAASPRQGEVLDGWLYFSAWSAGGLLDTGRELWRSNGAKTELITDIRPGVVGSQPDDFAALDGWLYFQATGSELIGRELWRTNGTTTELVADIAPGPDHSTPRDLATLDGWVYFGAETLDIGSELWRTNGTTTELVADIWPGGGWGEPASLEVLGDWVYFSANTPEYGPELWRSNGTTTELVADIVPGPERSWPRYLEAVDDWIYFSAVTPGTGWELYRSNGTTTELAADIKPGEESSFPGGLTGMEGWVYFGAEAPGTSDRLWRSNGTITEQLTDFWIWPSADYLEPLDGWLYFHGDTPEFGNELWRTDGTTTELAADIRPGPMGSDPKYMTAMDGWLYLDVYVGGTNGGELWRTDGTTTERVAGNAVSSGVVDYAKVLGPRWKAATFAPTTTGTHSLTLYWVGDADLRFNVKEEATGKWVGSNFDDEQRKTLIVDLVAGTEYRVAVGADSGSASFEVALAAPDGRPLPFGEEVKAGVVDATKAAGPKWAKVRYTPQITGTHVWFLDWAGDANLRTSIREFETGAWVADNVTGDKPKLMEVHLTAGTEYKVAVWAKSGAAEYAMTLMAPQPGTGEPIFSRTVDADGVTGRKWVKTFYLPEETGVHSFMLDWGGDADLRMNIKDKASGVLLDENLWSEHPKAMTLLLEAGVEYKIAVWAYAGAADFTLSVARTPG